MIKKYQRENERVFYYSAYLPIHGFVQRVTYPKEEEREKTGGDARERVRGERERGTTSTQ